MRKFNIFLVVSLSSAVLIGCDNAKDNADSEKQLANGIVSSMVSVKSGRFQMGDFGPLVGEKLPFSPDQNNKPLHWVELSSFKITKNKITWGEFNKWLSMTNKEENIYYKKIKNRQVDGEYDKEMLRNIGDNYPASVNWNDAQAFCQWIGKVSGKSITLPTEAQWEYAARSGGQFFQFANSDNQYNPDDSDDKLNFTHDVAPVGSYPPNPLGLYDMMGNGNEWMSDWYSYDYYKNSPEKNPQGPEKGDKKVIRGYLGSMFGLYDITRGKSEPDYEGPGDGFRCVEN
ncbi:SUMF1/EgtB/PvdO family nonheme iron enzyme [Cronobacter dublinensis]|nr:SUMF1/EgtB/PvdO family nonheme iron enzyme [Cronobacter dublinensis]ELY3971266.1 SUMF1/EgtB/PvdO family nonheme iron enzyme [Cronobacter dublinensis]ELY4485907.1 SUMF1/EgtB/PvdO family nonheme iron enzyme [Cronobacter dublinensis]ELY5823358.1 SUMF1/EgtB/PvdO family nonheme iron enzyme [Cronobacter dublinensis]